MSTANRTTTLATPAATGFVDQLEARWAAVRRDRRPLPSHDLDGENCRRWAAAVCGAELDHANADFWRLAWRYDVAPFVDRYQDPSPHARYWLPHERQAGVVLNALGHLQAAERSIRDTILALTVQRRAALDRAQGAGYRVSWAATAARTADSIRDLWTVRRRALRAFLAALAAYKAARAAKDTPAREAA